MKPYRRPRIFWPLLLLALLLAPPAIRAAGESQGSRETPVKTELRQPAPPSTDAPTEDMHTLRQRYGHDPTGVRARLGMCRRGHGGGHGNGHGGGHGRGRGGMRDPQQPCPYGEKQWNRQP